MKDCGYVSAGLETIVALFSKFVNSEVGKTYLTQENICNFLSNLTGVLHSYGEGFSKRRDYNKFNKMKKRLLEVSKDTGFFNKTDLILDSGGFQVSINRLTPKEAVLLEKYYYEFLTENIELYNRAFILDLVPGPNCKVFKDEEDLFDKNYKSYLKASQLPNEVKKKIIYIHHFRTPMLWRTFSTLLKDYFNNFNYFATGGIVANMRSDITIPCIIYILPLIPLLNQVISNNRDSLDFHVLGGSSYRDVFFYEIIKKHVKETHNIKLNISYDSSGLFKGLMNARYIDVISGDLDIQRLNLKTTNLSMKCMNGKTNLEVIRDEVLELCDNMSLTPLKIKNMYDPETGTFYRENQIYLMLYLLRNFMKLQTLCKKKVEEMYEVYQSSDIDSFINFCERILRKINRGKITKKQRAKSSAIYNSLQLLTNLDEDRCEFIINKYLSLDEFTELLPAYKVLTF